MRHSVTGYTLLDRDKIDLDIFLFDSVLHTVPPDGEEESSTFGRGEALDCASVRDPRAVLDLEKDETTILLSDDIDLASGGRDVVRRNNRIVMSLEVLDGDELAMIPDLSVGVGHIIGGYSTR